MSKRLWLGAAAAGVLAIAALIGAQLWQEQRAAADRAVAKFGVDRADVPAPPVTLLAEGGKPIPLSELRGQVLFVNFWATWCPPCREEMPSMLQLGHDLSRAHPGKFRMLAVSVDEDWGEVRQFFGGQLPSAATVTHDPEMVATKAFYCTARGACPAEGFKFPETYIVDPAGKLVAYVVGPRDWNDPAARRLVERLIDP